MSNIKISYDEKSNVTLHPVGVPRDVATAAVSSPTVKISYDETICDNMTRHSMRLVST